jgi:hypothetical protein
MEMNQILMLVGLVIVGYLVLKFIWNAVGGILKLVIVVIILGAGTYLIKPELLYNAFGKENVEMVAKEAKDGVAKVSDAASDALSDAASDAADTVKEEIKNKVDTVTLD